MTAQGIPVSGRVDGLTYQAIHAKVVDQIFSSRTFASRFIGMGRKMVGKTTDINLKVAKTSQGQWFVGLENLNVSLPTTKVTASFAHTAYTIPFATSMLEAFANAGDKQVISLPVNAMEEARSEMIQDLGEKMYSGNGTTEILGLDTIVDDSGSVGGLARSTYPMLAAYKVAAPSGILSLNLLAQLVDNTSAAGLASEEPNIFVTTKSIFTYFEQLLTPAVRYNYGMLGITAPTDSVQAPGGTGAGTGFRTLEFRGIPILRDDAATSGTMFALNERYTFFAGRSDVPSEYTDNLEKINMGEAKTEEGVSGASEYKIPSTYGMFYTPYRLLFNQAGQVGRYFFIGQAITTQPRRNGKITGITGV